MRLRHTTPKIIKITLVVILILLFMGLGALYYKERFMSGDIVLENIAIDSKALLLLNAMHQTSTRNNVKEWTLDASSAKMLKDENKALMQNVKVVFFTKDPNGVKLTSTNGILDTKTHDITFSENVVVTYGGYTMKTDELHYDKKRHILYSTVHIMIMDRESILEADAMETDLNKSTTRLKGNVKGRFSEKFDFFSGLGSSS